MAESSLYTQRLEAIVGRRKVQERILRTRRELEEEKLRAQQLKRKSLRDRWLMEGSCLPPENDPTSPLWQTQSRIQELELDLSSLQSQMQQLDNPEHHGKSHEALEDAKRPAGGTCEARGAGSASAGRGGCVCKTEPALPLAPVPPKRAMRVAAQETLENGDVSRAGPFGVEGISPGESKTDASSAAPGTRDDGAGASAKQPEKLGMGKVEMIIRNHLGQEVGSMDAIRRTSPETEGEAPRGENGLEEAWDGRTEWEPQSPPAFASDALDSRMEESVAGEGSREGPEGESGVQEGEVQALPVENCCLDSPRPEPDGELEEPIGVVEEGEISAEPARGATEMEEAEAAQRTRGRAAEPERPQDLGPTQGRGPMWQEPAKEQEHQVSPGAEHPQAAGVGERAETKVSLQDQIPALQGQIPSPQEAKAALRDQFPALLDQIPSSLQEAKTPLQDQIPALQGQIPSPHEAKATLRDQTPSSLQEAEVSMQNQIPTVQDQIPLSLLEVKTSLQGQIPSPQEAKAALQDQIQSMQNQIPSSLQDQIQSLQDQIPSSLQDQIPSSLQEANISLQDQISSALQNQIPSPHEAKAALQDQIPSSLQEAQVSMQNQIPTVQDQIPLSLLGVKTSLQGQIPSPQEAKAALQDQIPSSLQDQILSSLQEAEVSMQNQIPTVQDQIPLSLLGVKTSLQGQIPSPQEAKAALQDQISSSVQDQIQSMQDQIPSSLQEANISLQDQTPSALQNQIPSPHEAKTALQDQVPSSLQDQIQSMQDQICSLPLCRKLSLQDQIPSALQDQIPSPHEAKAPLQDQIPSPHEAEHSFHSQIPSSQEPIPAFHGEVLLTSPRRAPTPEQVPSRPRQSMALKGGSCTGLISSATEETTENLGKLHPEQQPLLKEASGLRMGWKQPQDPVARNLQPGAGTLKSLAAMSPEAPTYTTTSVNTASPCQGRSTTTPRPGDGQETGRRKQKTCQCCSVM
ncbi:paralemmin-3 isoform X2 [Gopherus evgoodei]|uniref:paralemmin-3 isoform X2 n=1 Tax=Gopherus evgoodei TaxID=1825980 RepID=UPI0011CFD6DB|nr:paralemmin-3 isoform X2 [Gopherus evgoodei]